MNGRTFLYVIAESPDGPCKIGFAANVQIRLQSLQSGNPRRLNVEHTAEVIDSTAIVLERMAHANVGYDKQMIGEWFAVSVVQARAAIGRAVADASDVVTVAYATEAIGRYGRPAYPRPQGLKTGPKPRAPSLDMNGKKRLKPPSELYLSRRGRSSTPLCG